MHLLGAHSAHVDDYGGDAEAPVTVSEDIPFYASVIEFDLFSLWPDTAAPVTVSADVPFYASVMALTCSGCGPDIGSTCHSDSRQLAILHTDAFLHICRT